MRQPPEDDTDHARPQPATILAAGGGVRKKGTGGVRAWLVVDAAGEDQIVEAEKHAIMRRTGLPARDLRILDPLLSYPSTVLGRERAIVINLEHIKAIITAQEVLLLNSRDPSVTPFVEELQGRILRHHRDTIFQEGRINVDISELATFSNLKDSQSRTVSHPKFSSAFPQFQDLDDETNAQSKHDLERHGPLKILPFEFVALEACLEAACSCLDNEARTLEQEAHPALDKLTSKISTLNLERVRQIKSRLVAITGRVQKVLYMTEGEFLQSSCINEHEENYTNTFHALQVRDELEHLLDDDEDMAEMYLTEKLVQQQLESSTVSSLDDRDDMDGGVLHSEMEERLPETAVEANRVSTNYEGDIHNTNNSQEPLFTAANAITKEIRASHTSTGRSSTSKPLDVEELEMLLEAYFVQIDGTLNKLSTLREYVDDTEDYINIMLDDKQNHLLQMGVMLTTATLVVSAFVVVAGIFGMNINIELFNDEKYGMQRFMWTVGGGTAGSIFIYVFAIAWCKQKRLLE